jgi:hypothetical protein
MINDQGICLGASDDKLSEHSLEWMAAFEHLTRIIE